MTRVDFSPEAAAYIRQSGGVATLRQTPRHGCCGGTVALPIAEAEAPRDDSGYARHDLDSPDGPITLFVAPNLGEAGPLRVGLDRLFGLAALFVEASDAPL